jgi:hypothetical protein
MLGRAPTNANATKLLFTLAPSWDLVDFVSIGCSRFALEEPHGWGDYTGCADLHLVRKLLVYPGDEPLHVTADIDALPLPHLARELSG